MDFKIIRDEMDKSKYQSMNQEEPQNLISTYVYNSILPDEPIAVCDSTTVRRVGGSIIGKFRDGFVYTGVLMNKPIASYSRGYVRGYVSTLNTDVIGICEKGVIYKGDSIDKTIVIGRYVGDKDAAAAATYLVLLR